MFAAAFLLGALAIAWVGLGFISAGANYLALTVTAVIGAVYALGGRELLLFRRATASLAAALAAIPDDLAELGEWLDRVHPSLQNPVRLRIEGERIGLPGPVLTPYLVGLLVMLGMLGTFLGMVVTLNGAVFALEGTTDLQAIRVALASPIKGLGLAFGTSVAGVAASAILGLISAFCRRERLQVAQQLDGRIATVLRGFSLTHQRQETFKALQSQAQALPGVVDQLQAMMAQMERMSLQLNERLLANQESFHGEVKGIYRELATSVDQSLRHSLTQSAQAAGDSIKPVVAAAMSGIAQEASALHGRMIDSAQRQLDGLAERFNASADSVSATWTAALAEHRQSSTSMVAGLGQTMDAFSATFAQRSDALLASVGEAHAALQAEQAAAERQRQEALVGALEAMAATLQREWQHTGAQTLAQQRQICSTLAQTAQEISAQAQSSASTTLGEITRLVGCSEALIDSRLRAESDWMQQHSERMAQLTDTLRSELAALRDEEAQRGQAAVDRLGELQTALTGHLSTLGTALEEPITRLIETASEAPRAAADVIGRLRQEISSSIARDNELLEERSRIMSTLNALLEAINHAAAEQRAVIDSLVASSAVALNQAGGQFAERVASETGKLADIAAQVSGSAVEVSSLSEAFGQAVHSFNDANEKLIGNLQRIETAMDKSMARSDDQLAYYVAQAREIIDLSIMSQKEIFEELRQLPASPRQQTSSGTEVN
jgi:hypothetical protein